MELVSVDLYVMGIVETDKLRGLVHKFLSKQSYK